MDVSDITHIHLIYYRNFIKGLERQSKIFKKLFIKFLILFDYVNYFLFENGQSIVLTFDRAISTLIYVIFYI
jgi:hypothetical protein